MFTFLKEYIRNPRVVGAVAPSGRALAEKMMSPINFDKSECIVEYGPGLGSFTRELIKRKKADTELILIEQNPIFCESLRAEFSGQEGVSIICGDAAKVNEYLSERGREKADYVVSGLPFTSLPEQVSRRIFCSTQKALGKQGKFITFQYTMKKKRFFEQYFVLSKCLHEMRNLPPAYVLVMRNGM